MKKLIFIFIVVVSNIAVCEIPRLINYQGRLVENGVAVTGTKSMTFRLLDKNNNNLWEETQTVQIQNGIFNVLLGSITSIDPIIFSKESEIYLETIVDGTSLGKQRLVSVGYAFKTSDADTLKG